MTITPIRADERDHAQEGWLESWRSFPSKWFAQHMALSDIPLLSIVEDRVAGGAGFSMHSHEDMEILSFVLSGEIRHADSLGHRSDLRPGELQRMSAGVGIRHSEQNGSVNDLLHFLQIWIVPATKGTWPSHETAAFDTRATRTLLAAPPGGGGLLTVHQQVNLWRLAPTSGTTVTIDVSAWRHGWLHLVHGTASPDGRLLSAGDAVAFTHEDSIRLVGSDDPSEALVSLMKPRLHSASHTGVERLTATGR